MSLWDREAAQFVIDDVEQRAKALREFMRAQNTGVPLGQEDVDDETWATYFESKLNEYPIIPLVDETGRMFAASPFLLALEFADGGRDVIKRYERIRRLNKESA